MSGRVACCLRSTGNAATVPFTQRPRCCRAATDVLTEHSLSANPLTTGRCVSVAEYLQLWCSDNTAPRHGPSAPGKLNTPGALTVTMRVQQAAFRRRTVSLRARQPAGCSIALARRSGSSPLSRHAGIPSEDMDRRVNPAGLRILHRFKASDQFVRSTLKQAVIKPEDGGRWGH